MTRARPRDRPALRDRGFLGPPVIMFAVLAPHAQTVPSCGVVHAQQGFRTRLLISTGPGVRRRAARRSTAVRAGAGRPGRPKAVIEPVQPPSTS